jgi:hypothetical protein
MVTVTTSSSPAFAWIGLPVVTWPAAPTRSDTEESMSGGALYVANWVTVTEPAFGSPRAVLADTTVSSGDVIENVRALCSPKPSSPKSRLAGLAWGGVWTCGVNGRFCRFVLLPRSV